MSKIIGIRCLYCVAIAMTSAFYYIICRKIFFMIWQLYHMSKYVLFGKCVMRRILEQWVSYIRLFLWAPLLIDTKAEFLIYRRFFMYFHIEKLSTCTHILTLSPSDSLIWLIIWLLIAFFISGNLIKKGLNGIQCPRYFIYLHLIFLQSNIYIDVSSSSRICKLLFGE